MKFQEPQVVRGLPIPPAPPARRPYKRGRQAPSPWIAFISKLQPGDSFMTYFGEPLTVERYLKQLNIKYERRRMSRHLGQMDTGVRFWIVANDYTPEYKNIGLDI